MFSFTHFPVHTCLTPQGAKGQPHFRMCTHHYYMHGHIIFRWFGGLKFATCISVLITTITVRPFGLSQELRMKTNCNMYLGPYFMKAGVWWTLYPAVLNFCSKEIPPIQIHWVTIFTTFPFMPAYIRITILFLHHIRPQKKIFYYS